MLKRVFLDRCHWKGWQHFQQYLQLSTLSYNLLGAPAIVEVLLRLTSRYRLGKGPKYLGAQPPAHNGLPALIGACSSASVSTNIIVFVEVST